MRFTILFGLCVLVGLAYGQLLIDEDDPHGKKLIELMMKAINDHEKTTYTYKQVVYSIPVGIEQKLNVLIKVADAHGALHQCSVELVGKAAGHEHDLTNFSPDGVVTCKLV